MKTRRIFCSSVLLSEAFVLFFGILVAKDLADISGATLALGGGAAILACLLLTGLLRHRWAYPAGSVLQVLLIATGFVLPAMFAVGAVFAALWVLSLMLAERVEQVQRARSA